jgi:hypothetical protein
MGGALFGFEPAIRRRPGFGAPFARMVVCGFLFLGISVPLIGQANFRMPATKKLINI